MSIKKPSQQIFKQEITPQQADALADKLADKPYGKLKTEEQKVYEKEIARTTCSLPKQLLEIVEDLALINKRKKIEPKSVSAIVRDALELYLKK